MLMSLAVLMGVAAAATAVPPDDGGAVEQRVVVIQCDGADDATADVLTLAAPADGAPIVLPLGLAQARVGASGEPQVHVFRRESAAAPAPNSTFQIGVRTAPVPPSLAAHVGPGGVLVANVVKALPGDVAGLERYDIIRAFNGQDVTSLEDLVNAIEAAGATAVPMHIVRAGQEHMLTITPSVRGADTPAPEWKYAESDDPLIRDSTTIRGLTLRKGPGGVFQFEELGELKDLPDMLKDLQIELPSLPPFEEFDWTGAPDVDSDASVEIQIIVDAPEGKLSLKRSADGVITVERTAPDGQTTTATYPGAEELRAADPDAYEHYQRCTGDGHRRWMVRTPRWDHLGDARRDFDEQIRQYVDQLRDAAGRTGRQVETRLLRRSEALKVDVQPDGSVRVEVNGTDGRATYEFASEDEFRAQQPKLYERYERLLNAPQED